MSLGKTYFHITLNLIYALMIIYWTRLKTHPHECGWLNSARSNLLSTLMLMPDRSLTVAGPMPSLMLVLSVN